MKVLLATLNPAKQAALRRLLEGLPAEPVTHREAGLAAVAAEEDRPTHAGNAEAKALEYAAAAGLPAIASDGGVEIPALGPDWDGLRTRRFAGPTDAHRIAVLLDRLRDVPEAERMVRLHEAVAVADPARGIVASAECAGPWGRLAFTADSRVQPGFWLPALWLYPPRWVTEWDLTDSERTGLRTAWDEVAAALRPALKYYLRVALC